MLFIVIEIGDVEPMTPGRYRLNYTPDGCVCTTDVMNHARRAPIFANVNNADGARDGVCLINEAAVCVTSQRPHSIVSHSVEVVSELLKLYRELQVLTRNI